jgi:hypothetical protein
VTGSVIQFSPANDAEPPVTPTRVLAKVDPSLGCSGGSSHLDLLGDRPVKELD